MVQKYLDFVIAYVDPSFFTIITIPINGQYEFVSTCFVPNLEHRFCAVRNQAKICYVATHLSQYDASLFLMI